MTELVRAINFDDVKHVGLFDGPITYNWPKPGPEPFTIEQLGTKIANYGMKWNSCVPIRAEHVLFSDRSWYERWFPQICCGVPKEKFKTYYVLTGKYIGKDRDAFACLYCGAPYHHG